MALWHLTESALRRSQGSGGQAVWLSPELRADAEMRMDIAANMSKMLEEDSFHLVYQPLYCFEGSMCGMEALLRLNHPLYGAVPPLPVIQTAEETGLIEPLGQWVIERACRQLKSWMDEGVRLVPLAINVSSLQLMRKGFAEQMAQTLDRYSVNPQLIHLEITETAAMDNVKQVSREMSILSALGSKFSIDDFGTGHSSLGRLHRLPISILKIDRSFIEHLCNAGREGMSSTIVEAIVSMAHALELQVVAEGVETEDQLECLRRLGCDLLQGFLLSRPVPPEQIPDLISRTHPLLGPARREKPCVPEAEIPEVSRTALKG
jgi:EAL domain-containing protein (putative c-di-GMP-specific phosphodiesterase class I)